MMAAAMSAYIGSRAAQAFGHANGLLLGQDHLISEGAISSGMNGAHNPLYVGEREDVSGRRWLIQSFEYIREDKKHNGYKSRCDRTTIRRSTLHARPSAITFDSDICDEKNHRHAKCHKCAFTHEKIGLNHVFLS